MSAKDTCDLVDSGTVDGGVTQPGDLQRFLRDLMPRLGEEVRRRFADPGPVHFKKPGNPVTKVDRDVEAMAKTAIRAAFPDHDVHGEESGLSERGEVYRWFIDPIDGTMNFVRGIPIFSISIGVARGDDVVAGAVLDPLRGELFHAAKGEGAWLNDAMVHIGAAVSLADAMVSVQSSARGEFLKRKGFLRELHRRAQKTRKLGTIALELAYTACGRMDLVLAGKGSPQAWWDIAGGWCLVAEAGGVVVDLDDNPLTQASTHLAAGNPAVVSDALALLREF
jgi:myo-inositol-1(or 4)-monophosphatase